MPTFLLKSKTSVGLATLSYIKLPNRPGFKVWVSSVYSTRTRIWNGSSFKTDHLSYLPVLKPEAVLADSCAQWLMRGLQFLRVLQSLSLGSFQCFLGLFSHFLSSWLGSLQCSGSWRWRVWLFAKESKVKRKWKRWSFNPRRWSLLPVQSWSFFLWSRGGQFSSPELLQGTGKWPRSCQVE